jgi:small multidrug resistance pump
MSWLFLTLAIIFEAGGTTMMKLSDGGEKIVPTILVAVFYIVCFGFLTLALKEIPVSIAYTIWCGVGIMLAVLIGYLVFQEPLTVLKGVAVLMIIGGVAILSSGN